ncbi:hypothetical protein FOMPIDRAFT_121988 [Fomitopsis schrenkii]|uniref:Uncharacterized protein n=1 Tax=Fomitopsis schrenkii TaxID=2126942 RepID=S8EAB8_FOMSC|nr:hypothetical protein FOMPIDRAFT_121988 [Fomitopsis schrenkii]
MVVKGGPGLASGAAQLRVGIGSVSVALEARLTNVALRDGGMERSTDQLGRLLLAPHPGPHSSLETAKKDQ